MSKHQWYRMWSRKYCPFISSAFMKVLLKRPGLNLSKNKLFVPEGNLHSIYFEKRELQKVVKNYTKFVLSEKISVYPKSYENLFKDFLRWTKKTTSKDFSKMSDIQLAEVLKDLEKRSVDFSEYQFYAFLILEGLGKEVENMYALEPQLQQAIATPHKDTKITKARLELLRLLTKKYSEKDLLKYVQKYAWLPVYDFVDEPLTIAEVKKDIKGIKNPGVELKLFKRNKAQGLRDYKKLIKKEKDLVKKKKIEVVHYFSYLKEMRDDYRRHAYYLWQPFWKEYARRINLTALQANYLLGNELVQALIKKKDFKKIILARQKCYAHWFKEGKLNIFTGRDALKIAAMAAGKQNNTVIKGSCASKGFVKGLVCVVYHRSEFKKFKTGDILVTAMTHPEFLPIMKKAKAIITDEGGITCHASIVSRELGTPCIIGTSNATRLLKDGDLVEVDANNGIVRVLKRA
ncbi:MAG: PEP-utilizing enzyme [Candidatus Doudnabacteria bacterium]